MVKVALISVLFFVAFISNAQIIDENKELLWEISSNGKGPKSYLFGTIHSNDKRVFSFADSLYIALNNAETVVLETDIFHLFESLDTRKNIPKTLYDKDGRPYTGTNDASGTFYGDENGMPQFLDAYFEEYCWNAKKTFVPLESIKDQLEITSDFPISNKQVVNNAFNNFTQEKLIELYSKGDLDALDRFIRANLSMDKGLYEKLIVKRNHQMTSKLDSLLKTKKSIFCAVGAGHLSGSEGIIRLLRSKGYRLRPILWTVSEYNFQAKKEVRSKREFIYVHQKSGLVAKFPGKPFDKINPDNGITLKYRDLGQGNTYQIDVLPIDSSLNFEEIASIYIASPPNSPFRKKVLDDGTEIYEGLSDTYPEGINWVRIQFGTEYFAVIKTFGGNKFMHSDRPRNFFNQVWFE